MTVETLTEEEKMRRVPGIEFVDGPTGRRAHIPGGPDVWEIIDIYRSCGNDREAVADIFDYIPREQLQAAFTYNARFPDEIEARVVAKYNITPEVIAAWNRFVSVGQRARRR